MLTLAAAMTLINFQIIGPCSKKPLFTKNIRVSEPLDVGQLTVNTLNKFNIEYVGNHKGMNQIFNSPIGKDAFEVVSKKELRAYGWCYSINGRTPKDALAHQTEVDENTKTIKWYYGFARFKNGKWRTMCEKSYKLKSDFICN